MNIKEIKDMINLMNENGLTEIEIEKEGLKLRLKKSNGQVAQEYFAVPQFQPQAPTAAEKAHTAANEAAEAAKGFTEIKSPMVGTFYRAPAPDAAPYVQEGQTVEIGQVLCIVEAMKLMNEIKSEVRGKVAKILVENADPLEFGQTMFLIEASK